MESNIQFNRRLSKEEVTKLQDFYKKYASKWLIKNLKRGVKLKSFYDIKLRDSTIIGVFQGSRGKNPKLDIIIKYKEMDKKDRTPKHTHWTIDLLIKKSHNKELTKKFIKFLLGIWDEIKPLKNKEEQLKSSIRIAISENLKQFEKLNNYGEYTIEFIATVIELLMIQEKTGNIEAFMFKGVLDKIHEDKDIFSIVSAAGFN